MSEPKWIEDIGEPRYSVDWMEGWGLDSIWCGTDLEKAKKICIGKHAEGKNASISVEVEHNIYLEEDEDT